MSLLQLQCSNCLRIFSPGIFMENSLATFNDCQTKCPHCQSLQKINGTFRTTVEGFVEYFKKDNNPLQSVSRLFEILQTSKTPQDLVMIKKSKEFSKFEKWLPDTPEKIAAYIAIVYTLVQLFSKSPSISIDYDIFVKQYNQTVKFEIKN